MIPDILHKGDYFLIGFGVGCIVCLLMFALLDDWRHRKLRDGRILKEGSDELEK